MSLSTQIEEFLLTLKGFTAQKVEDYKSQLNLLFPSGTKPFESDQDKSNFLKSFLRNLRIFLKEQMEKSTKDGSNFFNDNTHEILRLTFWIAKNGYIDSINAFIIMEDIYDCLSMGEIETFFKFLEELLGLYNTLMPNEQKALLRIGNNILKKFSKVHDNDFRGRVQLFLAKITSLCEKTAVNLKSNINFANQTLAATSMEEENSCVTKQFKAQDFKELSNLRVSFGSYRKFWELQKFLQNPSLLFGEDNSIILEDDRDLEAQTDPEIMEIESLNEPPKKPAAKDTKVGAFCKLIDDIIEIFRKDPLPEAQDIFRQKNYPKYLTKYSLLNIQLKDPNFRKSWLMQVNSCLWNLKNPFKKGLEIKEVDQEKISNLEKKLLEYIKEVPSSELNGTGLDKRLNFFLEREKNWCQWKENGCQPFDKPVPADVKTKFSKMKDQSSLSTEILKLKSEPSKAEMYPNYKDKDQWFKLVKETSERFLKDVNFDKDNALFNYLTKPVLPQTIDPLEPSVGYYFNSFLSEMKDPTLTEEDKLASDTVSVWRGLRVLARNCINLFNTSKSEAVELKLDDVLKKMLKDPNNPEKTEGEAQDQKPAEEKKKSDKEEIKKESKEAETKDEKSETKSDKESKRDKETKPSDMKEEKPAEKSEKSERSEKQERQEERKPDRPRELTTNRAESDRGQKIIERIKPRSNDSDRNTDRTNDRNASMNKKRSPENDLRDQERQSTTSKKTRQ